MGDHYQSQREDDITDAVGGADRHALLVDPLLAQASLAEDAQKEYETQHARTTQLIWQRSGNQQALVLREPRQLYSNAKATSIHSSQPRWPFEIPCIEERPQHISYIPRTREPFYSRATDDFPHQVPKPYNKHKLVYFTQPNKEPHFIRGRAGPSMIKDLKPAAVSPQGDSETLVFEARFESGNLQQVNKVGPYDYELYLRHDLYTKKHTQWFYFRVQNTRADTAYRFTIMNLLKPASLYNEGLKPVFYSEKDAQSRGVGWVRKGSYISYYKNMVRRADNPDRCCYSLSWTCQLPYSHDTCYFAHCYPYTYTDLQEYLKRLAGDPVRARFCRQRILAQSIAGNYIQLLTITSPSSSPMEAEDKKAVVVTARIHPGETNGSWMMKGFLDFICGPSADAKVLRDCFVFKVIPMLNPDGVIAGNYRCSLAGRDLNRNYRTNYKEAYPGIWSCREMVKRLLKERDVIVYCDLHGHSRKNNVFMYGCENKDNPLLRFHERVFPLIMDKLSHGKFQFDKCRFKVQKSKEGTGRIFMWRAGILNSFTMEATYCGSRVDGPPAGYHFHTGDLEGMGHHFCDAILEYCDPDPSKVLYLLEELAERHRERIRQRLNMMGRDVPSGHNLLDMDLDSDLSSSDDGGSDSSGTDGEPVVQPALFKEHVSNRAEKRKRRKARREGAKVKVKLHFESKQQVVAVREAVGVTPAAKPSQKTCTPAATETVEALLTQRLDQPSSVPLTEKDITLKSTAKSEYAQARFRPAPAGPPHTQERIDERAKRQVLGMPSQVYPRIEPPGMNEYLTSLTNEYIRQGLLITDRTKDLPHISYSTTNQRSSQVLRNALPEPAPLQGPPLPNRFPQLEERSHPLRPASKPATASVIDLPHRPPSPPSFTSQFLANQLREPIQQTQVKVDHFAGEFQPVLAPSAAATSRSFRHHGSKSTGAMHGSMPHSAARNLGHNVASRYDRATVEHIISEHRKNAGLPPPTTSSHSTASAAAAVSNTCSTVVTVAMPSQTGNGQYSTATATATATTTPTVTSRDRTRTVPTKQRPDGKPAGESSVEQHKAAVKQAVLAVQYQQHQQQQQQQKQASAMPALVERTGMSGQTDRPSRDPPTGRHKQPAAGRKEVVTVAQSSLVPPLVMAAQPARPLTRIKTSMARQKPMDAAAEPANLLLQLQRLQQGSAGDTAETAQRTAAYDSLENADVKLADLTLTPAVFQLDIPEMGVVTTAAANYVRTNAVATQPRQGRPLRLPSRRGPR